MSEWGGRIKYTNEEIWAMTAVQLWKHYRNVMMAYNTDYDVDDARLELERIRDEYLSRRDHMQLEIDQMDDIIINIKRRLYEI